MLLGWWDLVSALIGHTMLDVENICRTIGRNQWPLWTNCCLFGSSFMLSFTCKECENNRKWCIHLWLIIRARSVFGSSTTRRLNYWSTCTTQQCPLSIVSVSLVIERVLCLMFDSSHSTRSYFYTRGIYDTIYNVIAPRILITFTSLCSNILHLIVFQ